MIHTAYSPPFQQFQKFQQFENQQFEKRITQRRNNFASRFYDERKKYKKSSEA